MASSWDRRPIEEAASVLPISRSRVKGNGHGVRYASSACRRRLGLSDPLRPSSASMPARENRFKKNQKRIIYPVSPIGLTLP